MNLFSSTQIYRDSTAGAGSLGGFFTFGGNDIFGISNNHVIANLNNCNVGDPIWISGSMTQIGTLQYWVAINNNQPNFLDVALAKLELPVSMQPAWRMPPGVVQPTGFSQVSNGGSVYMMVNNGDQNRGKISNNSISNNIYFIFSGLSIPFTGLIEIVSDTDSPFSMPGESGSIVFDSNNNVVGLLIGTSSDTKKSYAVPFINGDVGIKNIYNIDIWLPTN